MRVLTARYESGFEGQLTGGERWFPCAFGRAGVTAEKREGDHATPLGTYALRSAYWRPDRVARPVTDLPTIPIRAGLGWCDAPDHPLYNRPVRLPFAASREVMTREDGAYDLCVTLSHNADPPVPGAGAAVFLHLTKTPDGPLTPTEGCVALREAALRNLLRGCGIGSRLVIGRADA